MARCAPTAGFQATEFARAFGLRLRVFLRGGRVALTRSRPRLFYVADDFSVAQSFGLSGLLLAATALLHCLECASYAAPVTVFAAASLTDSLQEIAASYQKQSPDRIVFNFAASGTLARQIEAGAPADIFFSADEAKMDELEKQGLVAKETRRSELGNSLVVVIAPDGPALHTPADLTNAALRRLALGDTRTVPAGTYARTWLEKAGLWPQVAPKVIPCENVRAVLAAVEAGNVEAGVVYKTDAAIAKKVKVAFAVPADDVPRISYPVALLKNAPAAEAAGRFLAYLASDNAKAIFTRHGFGLWPAAGK